MDAKQEEPITTISTPVRQLFAGRSVFITGASGFIGRVLLEKLLRTYQEINKVYILMRPKKQLQPYERLHKQLLKVPIFDRIKAMKNGHELLDKIVLVSGDIAEPQLGISEQDMKIMTSDPSLSIVFHSAATIKFDEPLRVSVKLNLQATRNMINFCRKLQNLVSFCHVSTAYANADISGDQWIEEKLYPMKERPEQLIDMAELMDEQLMQTLKHKLVDKRPNTYTYTKSLAEHLIVREASDLPVCIIRPSIVVGAWREPMPGWIDNLNGPTGMVLAIGKGLLRTMHVRREVKADLVPVDIVVNTMIASSYYAAKINGKSTGVSIENQQGDQVESLKACSPATDCQLAKPPIVHCNSGDINPITWGRMEDLCFPIIRRYPSCQVLRYPFGTFKSNKYVDYFTRIFVHLLPALLIDLLCLILGKKRQLLLIYNKLHMATAALAHFCTHNYNFVSKNIKVIEDSLEHPQDREELYLDIRGLDWAEFWENYVLGAR